MVICLGGIGAPTVGVEKVRGAESARALTELENYLGKKATAVISGEIGGSNSLEPIIAAGENNIPVIDGDGMGRAFPELQMVSFTLGGITATPMAMIDDKGNGATYDTISNQWTEKLARALTIQMGGSAMVSLYPVTAGECKKYLIKNSLSLIYYIGCVVKEHTFSAYKILAKELNGKHLYLLNGHF